MPVSKQRKNHTAKVAKWKNNVIKNEKSNQKKIMQMVKEYQEKGINVDSPIK